MKTGVRCMIRLAATVVVAAMGWASASAGAAVELSASAWAFLNRLEREAPELFYIPLSEVDPRDPGRTVKRRMEAGDDWLRAVGELVRDREVEFRFDVMGVDDAAEARSFPKAFCWRKGGKSGIVLRRFQDAEGRWLTRWDSGENWMMIVFELMNLEGFSATERVFHGEAELIDCFARSEFRAMDRTNDVFYRSWAPYCEKVGARVEMSHIPWFNRNVSMGADEWSRRAVNSPALKEYREWILVSGMHRLRERDAEIKFGEVK